MTLVLDSSVIVAALDTSDPDYDRCSVLVSETTETLAVPMLTLPEVDYLLRREGRADVCEQFLRDIERGTYDLDAPTLLPA